ncbi:hypothetical protein C8R45DRAFT_946361 [Mycena sanguinolenta]|nr:hypothetical protein C8R45DRAFT_946361 [Mycena sanguinolenta]
MRLKDTGTSSRKRRKKSDVKNEMHVHDVDETALEFVRPDGYSWSRLRRVRTEGKRAYAKTSRRYHARSSYDDHVVQDTERVIISKRKKTWHKISHHAASVSADSECARGSIRNLAKLSTMSINGGLRDARLPPELEHRIFKIAALTRPTWIPALMLVAKLVKYWSPELASGVHRHHEVQGLVPQDYNGSYFEALAARPQVSS